MEQGAEMDSKFRDKGEELGGVLLGRSIRLKGKWRGGGKKKRCGVRKFQGLK